MESIYFHRLKPRSLLVWLCLAWMGLASAEQAPFAIPSASPQADTSAYTWVNVAGLRGPGLNLLPQARILRDPGGSLAITDILGAEGSPTGPVFLPLPGHLSAGYTTDAFWLRLKLARTTAHTEPLWLVVWPPLLDHIDLFVVEADGSYQQLDAGNHLPLAERAIGVPATLFPITLETKPRTYYLRIQSTSPVTLSLYLMTTALYMERALLSNTGHGLLFGSILTALIASALGSLWLRRRVFYLASAYLAVLGLMNLSMNGYDQVWIYPETPWLADNALGLFSALSMAMTLWFVLSYLEPRRHYPRLDRLLQSFAWFFVILGLGAALGYHQAVAPLFQVVAFLGMGLIVALFVAMFSHARQRVILMLVTFLPVTIAVWLRVLRNLGLLPNNFWTSNLWEAAIFLLVVFLVLVVLLRMQDEQRQYQDSQARQQAQQRFLRLIAHELRTPLAIIDAAIANLEARIGTDQPELQPRFQRMRTALARLNILVDNALLEDRLSGTHLPPQREPIRPSQLAAQTRELLVIDERRHPLRITLPDDDRPIALETHWMVLAILNLLDNAVKYTPAGGPIDLEIQREVTLLTLRVADRGIGIPPEDGPHLFDRFFRGAQARDLPGVSGVGLGLYLVRQVVERHGGQIAMQPRPDGGSVLTLRVPIAASPENPPT